MRVSTEVTSHKDCGEPVQRDVTIDPAKKISASTGQHNVRNGTLGLKPLQNKRSLGAKWY